MRKLRKKNVKKLVSRDLKVRVLTVIGRGGGIGSRTCRGGGGGSGVLGVEIVGGGGIVGYWE